MPYITSINNESYTVDTLTPRQESQSLHMTINGESYPIDWRQIATLLSGNRPEQEGGRYSLIINGRSYEIFARRILKPEEKDSRTYEIHLEGQHFEVVVEDERTKLLSGIARGGASSNAARIQAPMPGLVVNVFFEPGAHVDAGQPVVVLEAMKMENDLAAPISGTIKEVKVNKGQTVDQNQVLVIIEGEQQSS